MQDFDRDNTIVLNATSVEYSLEDASTPIDQLIELLEDAKSNGAEFVTMSSGNYRGAQWQHIPTSFEWVIDLG